MKRKKASIFTILICIILMIFSPVLVYAEDDYGIILSNGHENDNTPFFVSGMLPGDSVSNTFYLDIYHKDAVALTFNIEVTEKDLELDKQLEVKVTDIKDGTILYNGPMSQFPEGGVSQIIPKPSSNRTAVSYRVDISVDTSVDNQFSNTALKADFEWRIPEGSGTDPQEPSEPTPSPGETTNGGEEHLSDNAITGVVKRSILPVIGGLCILMVVIGIIKKRRGEQD